MMTVTNSQLIILASASPRRRQMFDDAGLTYRIQPADIDETPISGELPYDLVLRLAKEKAAAISAVNAASIVVAADTIVTVDDHILGKPADIVDAERMIRLLSGRRHQVMTGVCICRQSPVYNDAWVATTTVTFKHLGDADIQHYLTVAKPMDKAGAYAIQEHHDMLIESFDGLYSNVVGLPMEEVLERLQAIDN